MVQVYKSTCPLDCWDACSLEVTVDKGEVINIQGDGEHSITRGFICSKGKKHLERTYRDDRLTSPMVKTHEDEWQEITWEKAFELITSKISAIREQDSKRLMYYTDSGHGGLLSSIENYFFNLIGDVTIPVGSLCWSAGMEAQNIDFGMSLSHDYSDVLNSKTILLWGRNPADTAIHQMNYVQKARKTGTRVIAIDPRKTKSARQADEHISIKPGTDGALALAMANHIIKNNLQDNSFIDNHIKGFEEFKELLTSYTIDWAEKETGIDRRKIEELAELYATQKPAAIMIGYGIQRYTNSANTVRAIDALAAITGNIGIAGGGANYANKQAVNYIDDSVFGGDIDRNHRTFPKAKLANFILEENNPPIDMMFITKSNPFLQAPDTNRMYQAFEKVDFKVTIDMFMTDTARQSDLVLPCANFMEKEDLYFTSMGHNYVSYGPKIIEPEYDIKNELDIFTSLADKLNLTEFPEQEAEQWLKQAIKPLEKYKGISLEKLKEKPQRINEPDTIPWADKNFLTPSGKYELYSKKAQEWGLGPIPGYSQPFSTYTDYQNNNMTNYDFYFLTPHHRDSLHSQHFIDRSQDEPGYLYINPEIAAKYRLRENSVIKIASPKGTLSVKIKFDPELRTDTVYMYEGLWIGKGGSVNTLISDALSDAGDQAALYETKIRFVVE
ncbi:molybdopterin-containing oxidoreductase family protein [Natranaerobius thermophilus]|uniref:Molybdopterin oxidoreductase n=1 Tax=Natranaerobius thermophilus (strain ATCC BAA-1301 / DSM 18059 / JW/NM-WN-LF) TaxID=457570 RepID=B2A6F9_NATTJ|nr:molybdopterin-dependent oxidoreductase [Natranaerobius thermophilus]ACB85492.1 molybdopterin oxidoreductase [Natranaerobius thermophilus JW/NM-WN-LF]